MQICAKLRHNPTGIHVRPGERYRLAATGRWKDWFIGTTPDGFTSDEAPWGTRWLMRRNEKKRRMPGENWFALCGSVGEGGAPFRIGSSLEWTVPAGVSGELLVWANDLPGKYGNNEGCIELTVERIG